MKTHNHLSATSLFREPRFLFFSEAPEGAEQTGQKEIKEIQEDRIESNESAADLAAQEKEQAQMDFRTKLEQIRKNSDQAMGQTVEGPETSKNETVTQASAGPERKQLELSDADRLALSNAIEAAMDSNEQMWAQLNDILNILRSGK